MQASEEDRLRKCPPMMTRVRYRVHFQKDVGTRVLPSTYRAFQRGFFPTQIFCLHLLTYYRPPPTKRAMKVWMVRVWTEYTFSFYSCSSANYSG